MVLFGLFSLYKCTKVLCRFTDAPWPVLILDLIAVEMTGM
jgi:hypothetical protein